MSTILDSDPALRLQVEDLYADYAHTIDDDRLEAWPGFFTARGVYRVTTRENHEAGLPLALIYCDGRGMMADRVSALRTANIYEPHCYCHNVGSVRVLGASAGVVRARSNLVVLRTMADGDTSVFACGRSFDKLVEDEGRLRFRERVVVLDSRRVDTLLVLPL
ncbi:MAG TPA: aromatic-ring-hydroxylating dioxygenase subunit beta [Beijerinckiaceae bacterium]|jgi:anthranilate 1,2-dioxygenase small subunit